MDGLKGIEETPSYLKINKNYKIIILMAAPYFQEKNKLKNIFILVASIAPYF